MFTFEIEGIPFCVFVSTHAGIRMRQRKVNKYAAFGSIVAVGEDLLDMYDGDEFIVIDKELGISIVCGIHAKGLEIEIEIITVINEHDVFVKQGTKIYRIND